MDGCGNLGELCVLFKGQRRFHLNDVDFNRVGDRVLGKNSSIAEARIVLEFGVFVAVESRRIGL